MDTNLIQVRLYGSLRHRKHLGRCLDEVNMALLCRPIRGGFLNEMNCDRMINIFRQRGESDMNLLRVLHVLDVCKMTADPIV